MNTSSAQVSGGNFASLIWRHAERTPGEVALVLPRPVAPGTEDGAEVLTFGELAGRARELALGLRRHGLRPGDRVVVLFPLSGDFYALVLALLAAGMTAVFVDPAMGARHVRRALAAAGARAVVGVDAVLRYRFLLPALWRMDRRFSRDSRGPGLRPFAELEGESAPFEPVPRRADDEALVTFTSGSTGCPKGSNRTHGLLTAQHLALREHFPDEPGEVVMPGFPVVALHDLCCGLTTVIPESEPRDVVGQMAAWKVSALCAAPAWLRGLLPLVRPGAAGAGAAAAVRHVLVGGAPVPPSLCRDVLEAFPNAAGHVVYGSTEAEPISGIAMETVAETAGRGFLVGPPARVSEVVLADLRGAEPDARGPDATPTLGEDDVGPYRVGTGEVGEVLVRGPHVNRGYVGNPAAERRTKLYSRDGRVWHRTGDLAYFDGEGRLWLLGRLCDVVCHRGRSLHPLLVEAEVDALPGVAGSALVAHRRAVEGELLVVPGPGAGGELASRVGETLARLGLGTLPVRLVEAIPMEKRHRSKIDRPGLRRQLEAAGWRFAPRFAGGA